MLVLEQEQETMNSELEENTARPIRGQQETEETQKELIIGLHQSIPSK